MTDAVDPDLALAREVYHRRMLGQSNVDIADHYDITSRQVATLFRRFCTYLQTERPTDEEARNLELDRLEMVQQSMLSGLQTGDPRSASVVLKTIQMRAELMGLNKIDARNVDTLQQILIIGNDRQSFVEAINNGQLSAGVDETRDTVLEGRVEEGEPL